MRVILFLSALFLLTACSDESEAKKIREFVSQTEPREVLEWEGGEIPVYDFDGFQELLAKEDDYTYVVNFWATWCAPCVKELPYFGRIMNERPDAKLRLVLVSLDMPKMWESHLVPFVKERDLQGRVLVLDDPRQNDWIPAVDQNWSGAIPATLIYNNEKRKFFEQPFTYEELQREIDEFLNT